MHPPQIAFISFDPEHHAWLFDQAHAAELSEAEAEDALRLLLECVDTYNAMQDEHYSRLVIKHPDGAPERSTFIIDPQRYYYQYIAVTNSEGEKEVWINALCSCVDEYWKEVVVLVRDGGNCYFNLKVNLSRSFFYEFAVNGEA